MKIHISVVTLAQPCSACNILNGLTEEVVSKLEKKYPELLDVERIVISGQDLHGIRGLEVEKFPALIFDGLQLTAGSIPNRKQLAEMVEITLALK